MKTMRLPVTIILLTVLATTLMACGGGDISVTTEGSGQVSGLVNGESVIYCGADCSYSGAGSYGITLTAIAYQNSNFLQWRGDADITATCGSNPVCAIDIPASANYDISAIFAGESIPGYEVCSAYLADGIKGFFFSTNDSRYFNAERQFLCKTDWNANSNTILKGEVEGLFTALFGEAGDVSIDNKINFWMTAQCTSDLNIDFGSETILELKYAADLELLQLYERCLANADPAADLVCEVNHPSNSDLFTLSFYPSGEGTTLTGFSLEAVNATKITTTNLPGFLTAYDNDGAGSFDVNYQIDDIFQTSLVTVNGASSAYGNMSCTQYVTAESLYTLRGAVSGLSGTVVLDDGNGYRLQVSDNGVIIFGTQYQSGDTYNAFVVSQPDREFCTISQGSGTFSSNDITNISVTCERDGLDFEFVDRGALINGQFGNWASSGDRIKIIDYDSDGLQDILLGPDGDGNFLKLHNSGGSFTNAGSIPSGYGGWGSAGSRIRVIDFNADGLEDLLLGPDGGGNWYAMRNTGTTLLDSGPIIIGQYGNWDGSANRIKVMDYDVDGDQDIILGPDNSGSWFVLRNTAGNFTNLGAVISGAYGNWAGSGDRVKIMDYDADNRDDIVIGPDSSGKWYALRNSGNGFENMAAIIPGSYANWDGIRIRVIDINVDNKDDIMIGPDGSGNWFGLLNENGVFRDLGTIIPSSYGAWASSGNRIRNIDFNGNGSEDILLGPDASGNWYIIENTL